ncbi:hypothetical protein Droror1_Dr00019607 [Drosera rotundifolia]
MATSYPTPISPDRTRIGWIGIGVMGAAMATRLLAAGYSVTIYARTPSKASALVSLGATLADSPASLAATSDIIFTMLGHPSDVREIVLDRKDAVLKSLKLGGVLVDHTSSSPELAKEIYKAVRGKGCFAVDAPVSGGDLGARTGNMAIFAGGDEEVVDWLRPVLGVLGNRATYMGDAGSGHKCKIANQIVVGGAMLGISEGLVFAGRAGLDQGKWLEAVRGGAAGSRMMELFGERIIQGDFRPGGFAEYMVKDLGMAVNYVAGEKDDGEIAVLPGAALVKELYTGMVANGDGKIGGQGLITVIERINGK